MKPRSGAERSDRGTSVPRGRGGPAERGSAEPGGAVGSLENSLFDSHCHLDFADFGGELEAVLGRARDAGVVEMIVVSCAKDAASAGGSVALAQRHPGLHAAVGIHPHDAALADETLLDVVARVASAPETVAIGEMGLDFHYDHSPRPQQAAAFRAQIALARRLGKPIVVHTREAPEETLAILREEGARDVGGVIHCFTEDEAFGRAALDLGFSISFSGIVTFKGSVALRDVARLVPLDRLLIETDSPYLAPVPHRGKRNEPAFVAETARVLAEVRGTTPGEIAAATARNTRRLFRLPPPPGS